MFISIFYAASEFAKLHMGLVVLLKKMSVLINFLLQNTNLVSVLNKICPNFAGHVWQDKHISRTLLLGFLNDRIIRSSLLSYELYLQQNIMLISNTTRTILLLYV